MADYSVKLPLLPNGPSGYHNITDLAELTKQNLKNLLLTSPGERVMVHTFGVGLRNFLFELNTIETHDKIKIKIRKQVKKYMSYIEIGEIEIDDSESFGDRPSELLTLNIHVSYFIKPLGQVDVMELNIKSTPAHRIIKANDLEEIASPLVKNKTRSEINY